VTESLAAYRSESLSLDTEIRVTIRGSSIRRHAARAFSATVRGFLSDGEEFPH